MNEMLITTEQLQEALHLPYRKAVQIGDEAGARIMIGKTLRWEPDKIKTYLKEIAGK